jgi:Tol biopolymer transport system component
VLSTVVAIAACSAVVTSQTPSGHAVFEQALAKERVDGNLQEAIRLYERVVAEFPSDRPLVARALLQMGLCSEKLANQAGARSAYERLQRDYSDQVQIAGEAKTRLAALPRDATARQVGMTVRELPNVPAPESVSPDGTRAVVTDYTKGFNLAIVELATGQSRFLTNFDYSKDAPYAAYARWSPDGRQIGYVQHGSSSVAAASELRVATLDGKARTIPRSDCCVITDWLPDGSGFIAATRRPDGRWAIGLVPIAEGGFTPLRTLGWDFTWRDHPRVSPDGRFVAFVERTAGQGDLHVLSLDGSQLFTITDHPADDSQPIWSPDGRQLAFMSNRFGSDALWIVTMEDGDKKGQPVKLKDGMTGADLVDWRSRGLIYNKSEQSWDIFTMPMDPRTARSTGAPRPIPYARSGWNVAAAWSPDGASLAFVSGSRSDLNRRYLVVMTLSGATREYLIPPNAYQSLHGPGSIRWFGNGRGLGFAGSDAKGQDVMFRLSLPSGEWTTIPRRGSSVGTAIEWNDDGTEFYFARQGNAERNGIVRKNVDNGSEELLYELTTREAFVMDLEISPDRRRLAFQTVRDSVKGSPVIVLDLGSGERRTVASLTGASADTDLLRSSGWSPDGRVLVQHRPSGSGSATWSLVPPEGGATQPLSIDIPASMGSPRVKWSPDGSAIAFVRSASSSHVFILENPLADLAAGKIGATRR